MLLILLCVTLSGVLFDRVLYLCGWMTILARYPAAILFSYSIFFVLIKIWLKLILPQRQSKPVTEHYDLGDDGDSIWRFLRWRGNSGGGSSASSNDTFSGGGGRSGGGGASVSWDAGPDVVASDTTLNSFAVSDVFKGKLDIDSNSKDGLGGLIAGLFLVVAIIGVGLYVICASPALLSEAAFEFALATGVIRSTRRALKSEGWIGSVFRNTWIPLVFVLAFATLFGWVVHENCPNRTTASEVIQSCVSR